MGPSPSCLIGLGHAHAEQVSRQREDSCPRGEARPLREANAQHLTLDFQPPDRETIRVRCVSRLVGGAVTRPPQTNRKEQSAPSPGVSGAA